MKFMDLNLYQLQLRSIHRKWTQHNLKKKVQILDTQTNTKTQPHPTTPRRPNNFLFESFGEFMYDLCFFFFSKHCKFVITPIKSGFWFYIFNYKVPKPIWINYQDLKLSWTLLFSKIPLLLGGDVPHRNNQGSILGYSVDGDGCWRVWVSIYKKKWKLCT